MRDNQDTCEAFTSSSQRKLERWNRVAAFVLFQAVFHGVMVATLLLSDGLFQQHLARSAILLLVFSLNTNLLKSLWLSVLVYAPYGAAVLLFYGWFAYSHLALATGEPVHNGYLVGVIAYVFGTAAACHWIVWRAFGVSASHIFAGSTRNPTTLD